jgi:1-aminocyclopropane-1-carboxylate deaminase
MHLALPDQRLIQPLPSWNKGIEVFVQREDLQDPWLGGNKSYKLYHNLESFRRSGKSVILTFGGAWSNYLIATAEAGRRTGIRTVGLVRGDAFTRNPRLDHLQAVGMQLVFIDRLRYRRKEEFEVQQELLREAAAQTGAGADAFFVIPEGGANTDGFLGSRSIVQAGTVDQYSHFVIACGTGTTLAGIADVLSAGQLAIGIAVVRDFANIRKRVRSFGVPDEKFLVREDFTFGGYARSTEELSSFCHDFRTETGLPIEPVYTGKLFYAVRQLILERFFPAGSRILVIHTGGIFPCDHPLESETDRRIAVSNS